jgi:hypothetical protein
METHFFAGDQLLWIVVRDRGQYRAEMWNRQGSGRRRRRRWPRGAAWIPM